MEPTITTQTPPDSNILAYGVASQRPRGIFLVAIIACICLLLGCVFWLLLSRPCLIPETSLLVVATPKRLSTVLPADTLSRLPTPWHESVSSRSSWPAVFGAYKTDHGWQTFVIAPRWISLPTVAHKTGRGLVQIFSDETLPQQQDIRYTNQFSWWLSKPFAQLVGKISLAALEPSEASASSSSIFLTYQNGEIDTDLVFADKPTPLPLKNADLEIRLDDIKSASDLNALLGDSLLPLLPITTSPIKDVYVQWNDDFTKNASLLTFTEPINDRQAKDILANFGIYSRSTQTLPDGGLFTEQKSFTPSAGQSLFQTYNLPNHTGQISLLPEQMTLDHTESSKNFESLNTVASCQRNTPIGRLSGRLLGRLAQHLGFDLDTPWSAWQIFATRDNKLKICLEK